MEPKMRKIDPVKAPEIDGKLREFERKATSVWEISKAFVACVYGESRGTASPIGSATSVELVAFYNENGRYLTEYLKVNYRGGAYAVRNATGNSMSANLREIAKLVDGGYYQELDDYKKHMARDVMVTCHAQNADGYRLVFEKRTKFGVVAIDVPWNNSECIGVYDSIEDAAKGATEHLESCAKTFGYAADNAIEALEGFQEGRYRDPESGEPLEDDGYNYLIAECPEGSCVYVLEEPYDGSESELHGPYRTYEEANSDLFVGETDANGEPAGFKLVPGTFGPGFYPVDIPEAAMYYIYTMEE